MAIGGAAPPIPPEVLAEERDKIRQQLELERGKSRILYERAYQDYLTGQTGREKRGAKTGQVESETDFITKIRKAYGDAYALRAFRDIMDETTAERGAPPETMPSADNITTSLMKSGLPPQVVNQWLKSLEPEALGALIALSSQQQNPALSMMAYGMSNRGNQPQQLTIKDVIELNNALSKTTGQPNISIDLPKLIESVKAAPATASPTEIVNSTIAAIKTGIELASAGRGSEELRPKGGLLERLLETPEGAKTAKEIGLIGGDASMMTIIAQMRKNDQDAADKARESDRRWDLRLEQLTSETELKREQIRETRHRTDMIGGALQRIGKAVADGLAEGGGGEEKGAGQISEDSGLKQYTCGECGSPIIVPPDAKIGGTVECAKCHARYEIQKEGAK